MNEAHIRERSDEDATAAGSNDSAVQQEQEASGVGAVESFQSVAVSVPLDAHFEATHLELPEEFRFEDADNWVRMVRTSRRGNQWWAGDLANALESRFPDRYSQYDHTDFGYTPESLANAQRVCAHYEVGERWSELTFGHHALVAAREDRQSWLETAAIRHLSVAALRRAIGAVKPRPKRWSLEELRALAGDWRGELVTPDSISGRAIAAFLDYLSRIEGTE